MKAREIHVEKAWYTFSNISNRLVSLIFDMFLRAISTSAVLYARANPAPLIKGYPVTLRLIFPSWRTATSHDFKSAEAITRFLSEPKQFLLDPESGHAIHPDQVEKIDPNVIYEVAGSGLPYFDKGNSEKGMTREQVWDSVFEKKTALALKKVLEKDDPNVIELPRVIKNGGGVTVSEWEGIYQLSDGRMVFLEAKFRMTKVSHQRPCNQTGPDKLRRISTISPNACQRASPR